MPRRIHVLGPVPPPYGGVSIHIVRFLELLRSEGLTAVGHSYTGTTRQGKGGKLLQALRMLWDLYRRVHPGRDDVLHLHYGGLGYFLAIAPLLRWTRARKVVTFHSVRVIQDLANRPEWLRQWVMGLLAGFDLFVPVRAEIGTELARFGVLGPEVTVMPAFLPPAPAERDLGRLPAAVAGELESGRAAGRQQVCCAAYYLGPGYGQEDLYGIDELLQAALVLDETPYWDLWVLVSNRPETAAQKEAEARILNAAAALQHGHLHLHYGLPLIPVMARCGAFLRPSREDGDSVAIREALSMGLPVLASDVVERPEGVTVFAMNDPEATGVALRSFWSGLALLDVDEVREILPGERDRFRRFVQKVVDTAEPNQVTAR